MQKILGLVHTRFSPVALYTGKLMRGLLSRKGQAHSGVFTVMPRGRGVFLLLRALGQAIWPATQEKLPAFGKRAIQWSGVTEGDCNLPDGKKPDC